MSFEDKTISNVILNNIIIILVVKMKNIIKTKLKTFTALRKSKF